MSDEQETKRGFDDNLNFFWERKFIIDGEHRISKVAPQIPMSEDTLYAYVRGIRTMPTSLRVKIAELVKDKTLLDKAFDGTAFELQWRERGNAKKPKELKDETLSLIAQIGTFSDVVRVALKDERLSENERSELQVIVNKMRAQLEQIADTIGQ